MSLPSPIIGVLAHFEPLFTAPTWKKVMTLLVGTFPRVAQRDEEEGKDGLSCGLKRLCLVDQNRSDEAHRAARKQERFQSERVQNG